jgi:inosine-uridine nucleoside N-ribohydrolase
MSIYVDGDTGIDDAVALAVLLAGAASGGMRIAGIGTANGNTSARQAAVNTLGLLRLAGCADIPVAVGGGPGLRGPGPAHGPTGTGPLSFPDISLGDGSAPELLIELAHRHPGDLHVLAIGPCSNLAAALARDPDLPRLIASVTVMGGAIGHPVAGAPGPGGAPAPDRAPGLGDNVPVGAVRPPAGPPGVDGPVPGLPPGSDDSSPGPRAGASAGASGGTSGGASGGASAGPSGGASAGPSGGTSGGPSGGTSAGTSAETNFANDPAAAAAVLAAPWRVTLVPLDVTMSHTWGEDDRAALHGTPLLDALGAMLPGYFDAYEKRLGERRIPLHDPLAAALMIGLVTASHAPALRLRVGPDGTVTRDPAAAAVRTVLSLTGPAGPVIRAALTGRAAVRHQGEWGQR